MRRHLHVLPFLFGLCALLLLPACADDSGAFPGWDGGETTDAAGAGESGGPTDGGWPTVPSGVVVVNSDYSSSSVSLLDRDGKLLADGCLHSGSGGAGLATTLSGDVVLPTQIPAGGPIAVIDRGNAAIVWLDASTCAVSGQLSVATGFKSNPHDVVALSASKAYVTRQDPNGKATPAPEDFDEGNDVLIIDPSRLAITGRIDLLPYAPGGAGILPRADRMLSAEGKVFVSLNAVSADYASYGSGRVVVVDPATDQVTGWVDLPGLKNCGALTYTATTRRLLVACNGAYGDGAAQAANSGIAAIDLTQNPPTVVAQVAAAAAGSMPLSNLAMATIDGNVALGVAVGDFTGNPPDGLWALPLDGSAATRVFASTEGFAIGAVLYDDSRHRVLAADATMSSPAYLRLFDLAAGTFTATAAVRTNPTHKLPPRALSFY
jgi:hypothetical protein